MTKPKAGVWHKEMYLERIAHLEQKYVKDCNIWLKSEQALTDRITQLEKERDKAEGILNCATHTFKHKLKTCCVEAEILQLEEQLKTAREQIDIMHKGGMACCPVCKTLVKLRERHLCYQEVK